MPSVMYRSSLLGSHISQQAQINNAVDARMKAQTAKNHYTKKLEDEKKKVDEAEDAAKVVEEEFNVCISFLKLLLFSHDHPYATFHRTGLPKLQNTANKYLIRARQKRCSETSNPYRRRLRNAKSDMVHRSKRWRWK